MFHLHKRCVKQANLEKHKNYNKERNREKYNNYSLHSGTGLGFLAANDGRWQEKHINQILDDGILVNDVFTIHDRTRWKNQKIISEVKQKRQSKLIQNQ